MDSHKKNFIQRRTFSLLVSPTAQQQQVTSLKPFSASSSSRSCSSASFKPITESLPQPAAMTDLKMKEKDEKTKIEDNDVDMLLEKTFQRHQRSRREVLSRHLPFSWARLLFGLISLGLVFSDIPRSSLGIHDLSKTYPRAQPDEFVVAGPSNISTLSGDRVKAANTSVRVWVYKYDTMSIVWRVFADHLGVTEFPDCFFYRSNCGGEMFNGSIAFDMLDALADALAHVRDLGDSEYTRSSSEPTSITIRSESEFIDRFHHFLLPKLFLNNVWRTNQALYYPPELLEMHLNGEIGGGGFLCYVRGTRPDFCNEIWINFRHMCVGSTNKKCPRAVGVVQTAIMKRVQKFKGLYPNMSFDLSILESQDDWQMARGGLVPVGFRRGDVASLIRARNCTANVCETVFVDEFRYQTARTMSDADQRYFVVSVLRSAGQGYFYLRFLALLLGCYRVQRCTEAEPNVLSRAQRTLTLVAKVPVQCVVYGSSVPVLCYAGAHLVDATITYTVLNNWFLSFLGLVNFSIKQFISLAVMQMRNVWLYATFLHIIVKFGCSRRWLAWSPLLGVRGVPEFLVSAISAITISSQYRSTSFRSTRILHTFEVPGAAGNRLQGAVRYQHGFIHHGSGDVMLGGVIIDVKFLFCALVALLGLMFVINAALKVYSIAILKGKKLAYVRFWGATPVPYTVGELWPTTAMCVHWTNEYFCIGREPRGSQIVKVTNMDSSTSTSTPSKRSASRSVDSMIKISSALLAQSPSPFMPSRMFMFIQQQMQQIHTRGEQVNANVVFMNLVTTSDPAVLFYLYIVGGGADTHLGYYQSLRDPRKVFLLPRSVVVEDNEHTYDLKLLREVTAAELSWPRLLQCG